MTVDLALPLDTPVQPNPPPRPRRIDDSVIKATALAMLPDIISWLGSDWREEDRDVVLADLEEALPYDRDGFERAQRLDRKGWTCDAALVEILDEHDGHRQEREAVMAWVAANGITPKFDVGARVKVPAMYEDTAGTIVRVIPETAQYVVATDKWLHEKPEQAGLGSGWVIPFEKVEALP